MAAYNRLPDIVYNEFDEQAAAWLRELIRRNLIAPGDVDTRSIVDVRPDDYAGFIQCHFFAGIGVWSYALRCAGWPDDRPVWTGSPPCQPFSAAGKRAGLADERHLWPAFFHLLDECRPDVFFGEQVASKDALAWLDHVRADVEGAGYAFGVFDLCAAGFGAPHIRQRLKFVGTLKNVPAQRRNGLDRRPRRMGHGFGQGLEGHRWDGDRGDESRRVVANATGSVAATGGLGGIPLADDAVGRSDLSGGHFDDGADAGWPQGAGDAGTGVAGSGLADFAGEGRRREAWLALGGSGNEASRVGAPEPGRHGGDQRLADADGRLAGQAGRLQSGGEYGLVEEDPGLGDWDRGPGPTNGLWGDADWLLCRDGKWRPVEPGSFPLAHGAAARVGRLRGYGNAIVAPAAAHFIAAFLDAEAAGFDEGESRPNPIDAASVRPSRLDCATRAWLDAV